MVKIRSFLFLLAVIIIIGLVVECQNIENIGTDGILKKRKSQLPTLRQKLIKYIGNKYGYASAGWLDVSTLNASDMKNIDLRLEGEKVICNKGRQLVSVSLVKEEFVMSVGAQAQFLLHFFYHNLEDETKALNPIPFVRENYVYNANGKNVAFSNGFKGYIVCLEKGEEAVLVPKFLEEIEFIEPEWDVRVNIQMLKNPLSTFGRMYRIDVIDNVSILKNGDKSFFWPVPVTSMVDVYEFHLALEDSEKGKYCRLSRLASTGEVVLRCRRWNYVLTTAMINMYFGLGFCLVNSLVYANNLYGPSHIFFNLQLDNKNSGNELADVQMFYTLPRLLAKNKDQVFDLYKKESLRKKRDDFILTNTIFIGIWLASNLITQCVHAAVIFRKMKKIYKKFQNAQFAFPWKLAYITGHSVTQKLADTA